MSTGAAGGLAAFSATAGSALRVKQAFGAFPAESSSRSCIVALAATRLGTRPIAAAVAVVASLD